MTVNSVSRRLFLATTAAVLCFPHDAGARFPRGSSFGAFVGNPNTIVSSVGGSITCPRTSGSTPCFVHVSASGITAVGTSVPYEDLEFNWNFGDLTGTETFVRPTDGNTVNANSAQISPEAFYCYRTAGTYTIRLTVRYQTSTGVYTSQVFTQTITVTAHSPSSTVYYDSNAPGGGDGSTAALALNTLANLSNVAYWDARRTNHRVLIARGSNFAGTTGVQISIPNGASLSGSMSGLRIEAYQGPYSASTAKPIINVTGSSDASGGIPCNVGNGFNNGNTKTDFVFSNISFKTTGGTGFAQCIRCTPTTANAGYTDMYWDNCDVYSDATNASSFSGLDPVYWEGSGYNGGVGAPLERVGFWGGSIATTLTTASGRRGLIGLAADRWTAVFGVSMSGSGSGSLDHFIYPEVETHAVYKWISIGDTGTGFGQLNFFINLNYNGTNQQLDGYINGFKFSEYQIVSECGVAASVTQPLQAFVDGGQSANGTATFAGGGSANITYSTSNGPPPVNAQIAFAVSGGGTLPPGIAAGTVYYVVSQSGSTIQISTTQGGSAMTFASAGSGVVGLLSMFRNLVIERNGLTGFTNGGAMLYGDQIASATFRGNRIWGYTAGDTLNPPGQFIKPVTKLRVYGNKIDSPSGLSVNALCTGDMSSYTQALQFTDNVIVDRRATTSKFEKFTYTTMQGNGSNVNRNSFYTDATAAFYDGATQKTFAQHQAAGFDVNSTVSAVSANPWGSAPTSWNGFGA